MIQPTVCIPTMVFDHIPALPNCPLVYRKPFPIDIFNFNNVIHDLVVDNNARGGHQFKTEFHPIKDAPYRWTLVSDRGYRMEFRIMDDETNTLKVIFHSPFENEFDYKIFYDDIIFCLWYALLGFAFELPKDDSWGLDLEHLLFEK